MPGLSEYLSSNWGIPVELARPFERVQVAPAYAEEVATIGPALAVAVGLGLRRPGDKERAK
jgi:Tfp pilus assembly PilM family ATPase